MHTVGSNGNVRTMRFATDSERLLEFSVQKSGSEDDCSLFSTLTAAAAAAAAAATAHGVP